MNAWELTLDLKNVVLDFAWLSGFLILGTILRRYGKFFQKFLIPNNIIAGFIGLILGPEIFKLIPLNGDRLGMYVYHLLAITFVAIGLRQQKTHWGRGPLSKAIANLSGILIQGVIGLMVTFLFIYTIKPDLFPATGLLLPLGFGNGPGLAYALGNSWEQYGFVGGGDVGLTFAALGYLAAYFIGIILIYRGIKNRETRLVKGLDGITRDMRRGVVKEEKLRVAGYLTLSTEAIEPLAFQIATIGIVYLLTYWVVWNLTHFMERMGAGGFVPTVWSFHFLIALLVALFTRKILDFTKKSYLIDRGLMNRLAGVSVDYLVVAAICAISLKIVWMYWAPILIMSVAAAFATYFLLRYVCWRAFDDYHFERFIALWGELTGTLNSALVLLRATDPEFKTPVAEDMVYGSGIGLFLGLPVLVLLTVPMNFFNNELRGYWIVFGLIIAYLLIIWGVWRLIGYIKFKNPYPKTVE
ncbi:MAG TPA: hypothetical protein ENN20_00910 [Candidatus Marinimicrobia bacterium]|nr:hypothetical protein [Candidatus Neomarinimicrobiota bacterium]